MKTIRTGVILATVYVGAASANAQLTFTAAGPDATAITGAVDAFRTELGTLRPNVPTSFPDGRREINWDAVPQPVSSPNSFPGNFFNGTAAPRARGVVFTTDGTGFQVSANAADGPIQFSNIDPSYPQTFESFSPEKIFTPIGGTITDVHFFLPGTTTPALTEGFGAVFSDVDLSDSSSLQFFDASDNLLLDLAVPGIEGNETFSFAGAAFDSAVVARVRINSGNQALGAGVLDIPGENSDVVALDDFIYAEPQAVADSGTTLQILLSGSGALALVGRRFRRGA